MTNVLRKRAGLVERAESVWRKGRRPRSRPEYVAGLRGVDKSRQLGIGWSPGFLLIAWMTGMMNTGLPSEGQVTMIGVYATAMTAVCTIACVVPARRALAVEPTEARRDY